MDSYVQRSGHRWAQLLSTICILSTILLCLITAIMYLEPILRLYPERMSRERNTLSGSGWEQKDEPAQRSESVPSSGHWLNHTLDAIATMQNVYWNGTYWPTTIQWMGALMNTFVATTDQTFVDDLVSSDNLVLDGLTGTSTIHQYIQEYYGHMQAYYLDEQTIQIFEAAYDDVQWVVLEWLEASKFITSYDRYANATVNMDDTARFAHRAHVFYNVVQEKFDTSLCHGGLTWNPSLKPYKNAITNELFISSSMSMYLAFPGDNIADPYPGPEYRKFTGRLLEPLPPVSAHDVRFLHNAVKGYEWFKSQPFLNSNGLIVDGFHASRGQSKCDQRNEMVYTYNQGVLLSGLRGLWEATGNVSYLNDGHDLISTTIRATGWNASLTHQSSGWAGLGRNGIMEDHCDAAANCSQDALIFKGAFFHHFNLFCESLPTVVPLVPGLTVLSPESLATMHAGRCRSYLPWVEHNAQAALGTRDVSGIMGQWWGAAHQNLTQERHASWIVPPPPGSIDVWNDRSWSSPRQEGSGVLDAVIQQLPLFRWMKGEKLRNQTRTVETQAQGLAVVKCAADIARRYSN